MSPNPTSLDLEELFHAALELEGEQRQAFLDRIGDRSSDLLREVEALLEGVPEGRGLLDAAPEAAKLAGLDAESSHFSVEAGTTVDDYTLVRKLGQGGMGEVWEAQQGSLSRRVALKLLLPGRASSRGLDFFAREARAGGRLSHPNIVSVHGTGESGGIHWIAMELIEEGLDLRESLDSLREESELPPDYYKHCASFLAEVAEALETAHQADVIHRDLKPANILVTPEDRPKVTDFGLAKLTDENSLSQVGELMGSYYYMSPEQVATKRMGLDHRTDIFSLGVVMYEMLTLVRPFEGDTTEQVARKIMLVDPQVPDELRSKVPRDLSVICGKCLEKDPDRRYPSMAELAADLRRHLAHEPIKARPPGPVERAMKWVRRHPTRSSALGVGAVALAGLGWLGLLTMEQAELATRRAAELELANADLASEQVRTEEALRQVKAEQASTEAERKVTLAIKDFLLLEMIAVADPANGHGPEVTVRQMIEEASEKVGLRFEDDLELRAEIEHTLHRVYYSIGMLDEAEKLLLSAINTRRQAKPEGDEDLALWMLNLCDLAGARGFEGLLSVAETRELLEEAEVIIKRTDAPHMLETLEVMRKVQVQGESSRDGLVRTREVPLWLVEGCNVHWKLESEAEARERVEALVLEVEAAWKLGGPEAGYAPLRELVEPYIHKPLFRVMTPKGFANTARWAEEAQYMATASALRFAALNFSREEELFDDHKTWTFWRQYAALLGRTEQWPLALDEARKCARHGDEHFPKDFVGRLKAHDALVLALRGAGEVEELEEELVIRLDLARQSHAEGGAAPVRALMELADQRAGSNQESAEALLLEAWGHVESAGTEEGDEREECARRLVDFYVAAGKPADADPFLSWVKAAEESE